MAKSTNINNRRYLGNKYKLLPFIKKVVDSECTDIEIVVDIFSGTGAVASAFQDKQLITNDILYSNYISNFAWFSPRKYSRKKIETIIDEYNAMVINEENYMTINFSNTYFSHDDCSKIGYIREDIETKYANKEINERERAFGCGQNIFTQKTGDRPTTIEFDKQYKKMFEGNLNIYIFKQFSLSKILDQIREYSDTTKRIFKATGIISFDNGFVELAYRELCACIFEEEIIKNRIAGSISEELHSYYDCYAEYEEGINSFYCDVTSLSQILEYYEEETKQVEDNIQKEFPGATIEEIPVIVADKRRKEFAEFIDKNYPAEKVKEILGLFSNRSNDKLIKDIVSPDATVPTIYEYVVGIAWYYFSGKRVDILSSYNLTLSANFEPLVHAGGGQGDIVIYEADKVIMLEATLMNASSQKRGEWEPVLRHSINLKVEEETANTGREVTSFFIADSFDYNTINIWKAVAAVPLQSSNDKDKFTDNVVIMPVNTDELSSLIDKSSEYDEIISKVHKLFEVDKINFDIEWREKFMGAII